MSKRIYKQKLSITGATRFACSRDFNILSVQVQNNGPVLYAEASEVLDHPIDINSELNIRTFVSVMTGQEIPENGIYIGTVMLSNGEFVVHIYEI